MSEGVKYPEDAIKVLNHGFVKLVDVMGDDSSIVQAARVSYGKGTKKVNQDEGLIRYLMRHGHTTPFEMVEFKFHCRMPIFVARQWVRHRTASINEYSGRYSEMPELFYVPDSEACTTQSITNKQGGATDLIPTANNMPKGMNIINTLCFEAYKGALTVGLRKELARIMLPLSIYTEWYWKIDGKNLLHFLQLRLDTHAQYEIKVYAEAMLNLIEPIIPMTIRAWKDYHINAMKLTKLEVDVLIKKLKGLQVEQIKSNNKREKDEWKAKIQKLGLNIINE